MIRRWLLAKAVGACANVVLRHSTRAFLFEFHDRLIEACGDIHPDHNVHNAGMADGLRWAADELEHFSWGHPEITMKDAAEHMRWHANDYDPKNYG